MNRVSIFGVFSSGICLRFLLCSVIWSSHKDRDYHFPWFWIL